MESLNDYWGREDPLYDELADARIGMHIPNLASAYLSLLAENGGLPDVSETTITIGGRPLTRPITEDPINTPSDPLTYPARLDNGQVIWVKLDERRSTGVPVSASVVDKPATVRATLAALTLMEGNTVDIEQLKKHLLLIDLSHPMGISESASEAFELLADREGLERALKFVAQFQNRAVSYALALLRYYRPAFDSLPENEKRDLVVGCCERINTTIVATHQLSGFLEYGSPNRDQRTAVENPSRDVGAAVLKAVENATYPQIANRLGVKISDKSKCVGDYSSVAKMATRGRNILERAFGRDDWGRKAVKMRAEFVRRNDLSAREIYLEDLAEDWGISQQVARSILEGKDTAPEITEQLKRRLRLRLESIRRLYKTLADEE